ncbi:MAG: DNA polymerase III subunit delta [Candidatus Thiodiazotropha sp. (ex Lucinoma aequizonata)]|nr:DNA polymerase III subunit delta [Candidatus Thiodiazotropha sp. (ex Lucinoma aequizonata)]MCU7889412.1 DNA polymerase III subunit delta [Candidatus Thiodiazotropha sp. (ex Lucinoma aequizonata)]MCU7896640.1 DNA polymerase III subunit delta [Candidatus Thiodiazotropha sp. (ex Lucinoma aequizonata)]MCU7899344.1 DNA polymerase III subunit delta [Candidatus Thiodiazotropha sp. (ex Lucinoma aequizonata)]MCU7902549.1 DNA polymerase III subunit delta [Candidatus Thiodiazotropha sp. (ex Lucinoma ae
MRLRNEQLTAHLQRDLAPVYLLSGDEPLQMREAVDEIRSASRQQGYSEREVLDQGSSFDWSALATAAESLSLFADRRLLELRLSSAKVGTEGSKSLSAYCECPAEDTVLLITLPKLERAQANSKWLKRIERVGVIVQIWPVEGRCLVPWIEQRLRRAGLISETEVVEMLAERVQGNLLAASQEIEKLLLLYGEGIINPEQLNEAVADSARFDIFGLVDTLLSGEVAKGSRMLRSLKAEGVASAVVLWALSREIRSLSEMAFAVEHGASVEQVMAAHRVWEKRKSILRKALGQRAEYWYRLLSECADADRAIKGLSHADPWLIMQNLAGGMAGLSLL